MIAAYRETEEEAGLKKSDLILHEDFKKILNYFDPSKQKDKSVTYWLAKIANGQISVKLSAEHQDYIWADLPEACTLAGHCDIADLLRSAADFLERKHKNGPSK